MIHWYWLIVICPVSAGFGFVLAAILSAASRADDIAERYEPVEHDPLPRVMPHIWDGYNRKEPTA